MVGYAEDTKDGYRLYSLNRKSIIVRRSVEFFEDVFPCKTKLVKNLENKISMISESEDESESEDDEEDENDGNDDEDAIENENDDEQDVIENENDDEQNAVNECDDDSIIDVGVEVRRSARVKKRKECGCCNLIVSNDVDVPRNVNDVKSNWYELMDEILLSLDFKRCVTEPCVYFNNHVTMGLYVDDIMLIGTTEEVSKFKDILSKILHIRDLGSASELLAVKIERGDDYISLSQTKYIVNKAIPKLWDPNFLKPIWTMLPTDYKDSGLAKNDDELLEKPERYRSIMGTLLYLSNNTRPDITYSLSFLCQRFENPTKRDLKMAIHLLRYVATTKNFKLVFNKKAIPSEIYCDADWGGDKETSRSVSGYVVKLCGAAVSWYSKKQQGIARSSMDAEYTCMSELTREIEWLVQFLGEINQSSMIELPCIVYADNASAIKLSLNNDITEAAKHIRIMCHVVKDLVRKGLIRFKYVCSSDNVADIFTKNLSAVKVRKFCNLLGLKNL
ncbi:Retrovirus-related Pol polyprotein from transposon RE1 [Frankliniella fusca]|uniref:Retrovirus-related Pol polyprotein from transposon RE1 n=1 Tax=Frankliniella fusca TaxID=407009 RepID=A0AAE1L566_9NEOP|nr:Retrovirus-related Pol polyprotein from transposon RE1 [Frankliniella fusca]